MVVVHHARVDNIDDFGACLGEPLTIRSRLRPGGRSGFSYTCPPGRRSSCVDRSTHRANSQIGLSHVWIAPPLCQPAYRLSQTRAAVFFIGCDTSPWRVAPSPSTPLRR